MKNSPISIVTNEDCMEMMARYPDKYFENIFVQNIVTTYIC